MGEDVRERAVGMALFGQYHGPLAATDTLVMPLLPFTQTMTLGLRTHLTNIKANRVISSCPRG